MAKDLVDFVQRLHGSRVSVTPFVATGAGHTYWKAENWYRQNIAAVLTFLEQALHGK